MDCKSDIEKCVPLRIVRHVRILHFDEMPFFALKDNDWAKSVSFCKTFLPIWKILSNSASARYHFRYISFMNYRWFENDSLIDYVDAGFPTVFSWPPNEQYVFARFINQWRLQQQWTTKWKVPKDSFSFMK